MSKRKRKKTGACCRCGKHTTHTATIAPYAGHVFKERFICLDCEILLSGG